MTNSIKSFIVFIVSTLSITTVSAQHDNSFIGIRFGAALPMGELASHEYSSGGYALLGKCYGLEAAWFINPRLGFGIDVSSNSFGFASGYYAEDMKENSPEFLTPVDMLSGPYKLKYFMGGAYYKTGLCKKLYSTFKLMGGMVEARTPDQFYGVDVYVQGKKYWWKTGSLDRTLAFQAGASLEYKLYDKVSILLQADFMYSQAAFTYIKSSGPYTNYMNMPVFKLQPGINIHF